MAQANRFLALDDLRGAAVLAMALSGTIPWGSLPAWMYHAQTPPPGMEFNPQVFGITWVDLVFPFFLFSMGAAIPFASGKDQSWWQTLIVALWRFGYLCLFGILVQNTRFSELKFGDPKVNQWAALGLGVLMLCAFSKAPKQDWKSQLRTVGVFGLAMVFGGHFLHFEANRQDIIIMVLAACSLGGALLWRWAPRTDVSFLVLLAAIFVWFIASGSPGLASWVRNWEGGKPLFAPEYLKYLLILVPGMAVGKWARDRDPKDQPGIGAIFGPVAIPICLCLLLARQVEWCLAACAVLAIANWLVLRESKTDIVKPLQWGWGLLLVGLLAESIQGGIRKDHATPSYFLVTAGLAVLLLVAIAELRRWRGLEEKVGSLALVGANALAGYLAITHIIPALIRLVGLHDWVGGSGLPPWGFAGYAVVQTLLVGVFTVASSRSGVILRA